MERSFMKDEVHSPPLFATPFQPIRRGKLPVLILNIRLGEGHVALGHVEAAVPQELLAG